MHCRAKASGPPPEGPTLDANKLLLAASPPNYDNDTDRPFFPWAFPSGSGTKIVLLLFVSTSSSKLSPFRDALPLLCSSPLLPKRGHLWSEDSTSIADWVRSCVAPLLLVGNHVRSTEGIPRLDIPFVLRSLQCTSTAVSRNSTRGERAGRTKTHTSCFLGQEGGGR